ncbi:hypothetical protein DFS33DRAFT_1455708 [Desarmillaria ectypa]|nr:hypothetical protein DFS33DRAFT_1455708 [Desarmillaria ectypa]
MPRLQNLLRLFFNSSEQRSGREIPGASGGHYPPLFPSIVKLRNGTRINPGQQFDFEYESIAEYGTSAYNFTVWLFTSRPSFFHATEDFSAGSYMGRYSMRNHPENDYLHNPPPPFLAMPNFEDLPVGFGVGEPCKNKKIYLAVIKEYATGEVDPFPQ